MGVQVPVVHTQIHRTPPRHGDSKRQFLSTLAPLTACVAGNKDDLSSYYTLAAAHHHHHHRTAANINATECSLTAVTADDTNAINSCPANSDERKVAPDVIAGTPGQEQQDELAAFAQQEANRTDKIKKRYSNEPILSASKNDKESDDDEANDYGFNKRPSVRGIKPKFSTTNEILQQMQEQLTQQMPAIADPGQQTHCPPSVKSYTLPKQNSSSALTKQLIPKQESPQNLSNNNANQSKQQFPQQQQQKVCNAVIPQAGLKIAPNPALGFDHSLPMENVAAANITPAYYHTLPAGATFRHTVIQQHQQHAHAHAQDEALLYTPNFQAVASAVDTQMQPTVQTQPHYGHYARSPTRRPESPPPLRNYHQTMVLIPYNAETYSQFASAATNIEPKLTHLPHQNVLEYQQVCLLPYLTSYLIKYQLTVF